PCPLWAISGHVQCTSPCLLTANSGLMRRSKLRLYSITSTARANVGGTISPSAFAVLRLITSSYLVGADAALAEAQLRKSGRQYCLRISP
ncbi:MAG: hypothetical protein WBX37_17960, partial [Pseudolabrys sp.]